MMIDATPFLPFLAAMQQAEAELAASDAEFVELSRSEQQAQVDHFWNRDQASRKAHDAARDALVAALRAAVAVTN
ncbi:hypothetical protein [Pseudomonas sp. DP-17]|uniref:hypothetical protein n=1 Tax=Pseudomonas sp. DP-17 TaxID=1580486 RepID=UPI001EFB7F31|nr:hypothetical protein [Pseudomonas sp. DP-17]MCG8911031.1 hypothetical protein [Pseudomonas sp. DP-17]